MVDRKYVQEHYDGTGGNMIDTANHIYELGDVAYDKSEDETLFVIWFDWGVAVLSSGGIEFVERK